MDSLIHADLFFLVTTVAVVVLTVVLAMALWQVFEILRDVRKIADILRGGAEHTLDEMERLKNKIENNPLFKIFTTKKRKKHKHIHHK